ncbi:PREDICTED: glutathione S-transferase theta-1-like isoform X2 [Propithecus coquereli]|uniref:glutathione S-transferase theta-1-like isoform X2 n=1 Tax=Propithecus coquereli TaxID=379532 RepID=UPI00063F77AE|nr:PREDICTED: glutathione S-transferase theta-1-like isoform X2 [Propithecus coquereli]
MVLELYLDLLSQPCRAVYIFARKNGIPFQLRTVELLKGMMFPVFLCEPVPPETLAATLAELDRCLQLLEDKFLRDQAFLTGSHISLADLVAISELMHPVGAGCRVFESRPKLAAWRQRVEAAVGKDLFQEANADILKLKDLPPADPITKEKLRPSVQDLLQ